jgi:hypothetical protein
LRIVLIYQINIVGRHNRLSQYITVQTRNDHDTIV